MRLVGRTWSDERITTDLSGLDFATSTTSRWVVHMVQRLHGATRKAWILSVGPTKDPTHCSVPTTELTIAHHTLILSTRKLRIDGRASPSLIAERCTIEAQCPIRRPPSCKDLDLRWGLVPKANAAVHRLYRKPCKVRKHNS